MQLCLSSRQVSQERDPPGRRAEAAGVPLDVDADIDSFFDRTPHDRLLGRIHKLRLAPYVASLFELWINAEVYDGERVYQVNRGIAQGSVVSPMLANLFLDELDENLGEELGAPIVLDGEEMTFRQLCRRQAERLARALLDGASYEAFHFPC